MESKFKKQKEVYIDNFELGVKKVRLIEHYTNHDDKGRESIIWVVKYTHKHGTYFNMEYEANLSADSSKYDKLAKKQELKDKITELQEEIKKL